MGGERVRYLESFRLSKGQRGLFVLMASLAVLFVAALIATFVTWQNAAEWRTEGSPGLPAGLTGATAVMFLQAWTLRGASRAIDENRDQQLVRLLTVSLFLGLVFLGFLIASWQQIEMALQPGQDDALYVFCFILLTGLHAAYVFCGFPPLLIVLCRATQREYTSSHCEPVKLCIQYWHFVAALWAVLLACLVVVTYA